MKQIVRTRIAPSPTGFLHIGTARTALFNYLFARQNKGEFFLRIEDTDKERSKPEFERDIIDSLKWLGLDWDGEITRQSERINIYEKYLNQLFHEGKIFWCRHSKEDLDREKKEQMDNKEPPRHICSFRDKSAGEEGILRFKNDAEGKIVFNDLIRGEISFDASLLGDFSVAKGFKEPLFIFANPLDDALMKITHVIRGEDHISNTPKQILILESLGIKRPLYAHLPLILGKNKEKLSKRHGAVAVQDYKRQGYLPQAMLNFMALLGWHPKDDQEVFTKEELIEKFELKRAQKPGAVFNLEKLNWLNKEHIKKTDAKKLSEFVLPYIKKEWHSVCREKPGHLEKIAELEKERLTVLSDIQDRVDFYFEEPAYDKDLLKWKGKQPFEAIKGNLIKVFELLQTINEAEFTKENIESLIMPFADENGRGEVLWPLRAALTGRKASPGPFEVAEVLGKKETLNRIKKAVNMI